MTEPKRAKARYKTINGTAYNAALKTRGSLTISLGFVAQIRNPLILWKLLVA